jgi:hypothetical protein
MRNRLDFVSDSEFDVPIGAPNALPYDATGTLRTKYWKYNHNNAGLHIIVREATAYNGIMTASVLTPWGS